MNLKQSPTIKAALLAILLVGIYLRLQPVLDSNFPIQDGGLFYSAIQDIRQSDNTLPLHFSYNNSAIPFVYPPFSLLLSAFLEEKFHWQVLDIVRILPAIFSVFTILAYFYLCSFILESKTLAIYSTLAFTFLPTSFDSLIIGGGITRSPGFLFAILTLSQVYLLLHRSNLRYIFTTGLLGALTIYTHPSMAWFTVLSSVIFVFFWGRSKQNFQRALLVILIITILISPWVVYLQQTYGLRYVINAFTAIEGIGSLIILGLIPKFTGEYLVSIMAVLGVIGLFVSIRDKNLEIPVWLFVILLAQRSLVALTALVPFGMLVAYGLDRVVLPGLASRPKDLSPGDEYLKPNTFQIGFLLLISLLSLLSGYLGTPRTTLTADDFEAISWIVEHTEKDSRFLILVTKSGPSAHDFAEWFPALTGRANLNTFQGYEWMPGNEFRTRKEINTRLYACAGQGLDCVDGLISVLEPGPDYFIFINNRRALPMLAIDENAMAYNFELIFRNDSVWLYRVIRK